MGSKSKIEWTDATWEPITGCTIKSAGCTNCYAMRLAGGRLRNNPSYEGLTKPSKKGPVWTGEVRFNARHLTQPLHWKKPRRIFVCSRGDLFHEDVPDEWLDKVFAVMALAPQHTFQVLTKRPERMPRYLEDIGERCFRGDHWATAWSRYNGVRGALYDIARSAGKLELLGHLKKLPLPNVWLGTSVEDQARADERIPHLLNTPAAVRWVSYEPALGPVDFSRLGLWLCKHWKSEDALSSAPWCPDDPSKWWWEPQALRGPGQVMLDQIIIGGESGPNARTFDLQIAYDTIAQCRAADVAVYNKQLGSRWAKARNTGRDRRMQRMYDHKGGNMEEWPEDLRVREYPDG